MVGFRLSYWVILVFRGVIDLDPLYRFNLHLHSNGTEQTAILARFSCLHIGSVVLFQMLHSLSRFVFIGLPHAKTGVSDFDWFLDNRIPIYHTLQSYTGNYTPEN